MRAEGPEKGRGLNLYIFWYMHKAKSKKRKKWIIVKPNVIDLFFLIEDFRLPFYSSFLAEKVSLS